MCIFIFFKAIPAMDQLMGSYPDFIEVRDLPLEEDQSKVSTTFYSE